MDDLIPLMQEAFNAGRSVIFSPRGVSMLPMLRQGIDRVVLSPVPEKLKRYDLPLYQRDNGEYVLHRIVETGESYICLGDNQYVEEKGIRQQQMIAVVTAFYRGEKWYSVEAPGYKLYCQIWHHSRGLRRFLRKCKNWIHRYLP
jgi:hypothetical protein